MKTIKIQKQKLIKMVEMLLRYTDSENWCIFVSPCGKLGITHRLIDTNAVCLLCSYNLIGLRDKNNKTQEHYSFNYNEVANWIVNETDMISYEGFIQDCMNDKFILVKIELEE